MDNTDDRLNEWNSKQVYTKGDKVEYLGERYIAAFWSQGDSPDKNQGEYGQPWKVLITEDNASSPEQSPPSGNDTSETSQTDIAGNKPSLPDRLMVGYIDATATGSCAAITSEQLQQYNVLIYGFTDEKGNLPDTIASAIQTLRQKITHKPIELISTGGATGSLNLDSASIQNLLNLLKTSKFDGIDLDLEAPDINIDSLKSYIQSLKSTLKGNYLLTIAPILAGEPDAPTLNIPGGESMKPIYQDISFDAIFVQAYNSGEKFTYPNPAYPSQQVTESSPDIIAASYHALDTAGDIHPDTRIVIGIPSNCGGAPTASNLWNASIQEAIPGKIRENLQMIWKVENKINPNRFGGLMCWSLNADAMPSAYPPYNGFINGPVGYFAKHVAPLMAK